MIPKMDVHVSLLQGNFYSKHQLHWKNELEDTSDNTGDAMKQTNYAGIVRGIRRVRKLEVIAKTRRG